MKNLFAVVALSVVLSACSTTKVAETEPTSSDAVKYTQDFGKVEVTYTDKGEWEQLKSTATSAIPIDDDMGLEQAMNVAMMRAKRNIVEFMQQDLKSSKTTDAITKSLAKNVSENDERSKQKASNIAMEITEKISVQADGILRGVYIVDRKVSSDHRVVSVTVQVDKRSMRAAKTLRTAMAQ